MGFGDGSGISWTKCKQSVHHSRQITIPTPHHSLFTRWMLFLTPTVSKHWRQFSKYNMQKYSCHNYRDLIPKINKVIMLWRNENENRDSNGAMYQFKVFWFTLHHAFHEWLQYHFHTCNNLVFNAISFIFLLDISGFPLHMKNAVNQATQQMCLQQQSHH